jgi:hypothetical protein
LKQATKARRRWLVVGPGLLLAGLAAVLVVWTGHGGTGEPTQRDRVSPAPAGSTIPHLAPAPDPAFLLHQAVVLQLTAAQNEKLRRLKERYQKETGEAQAALGQASGDFARQMRAEAGKQVRLSELQQETAAVSELSRHLAAERRRYWAEGSRVLTAEQRSQAETLWLQKLAPKGRP